MTALSTDLESGLDGAIEALYASARPFNEHALALSVSKEANEPLWLAVRGSGRTIGASDAAAALGVSPYTSPYAKWLELSGQVEREDISAKPAVVAGNRLEGVVREWFAEETHRRVERVHRMLVSRAHPFMHANLDGRIVGEDAALECKTAGHWAGLSEEWGPSGSSESDAVPLAYLTQCVHSMIVTGYRTCYLAVLIGGSDFRWYTIRYDDELAQQIVAGLRAFKIRVDQAKHYLAIGRQVPADVAPPLTTLDDIYARWPTLVAKPIAATIEIANIVDDYAKIKRVVKDGEEQLEALKVEIGLFMGEHDTLTLNGQPLCTFRFSKPRATFDAKAHAAAAPACHAQFVGVGKPSRTLLLKEAAG